MTKSMNKQFLLLIDMKTTAFKRTGNFLLTVRSVQRLKWEKWRNGPLLDEDKEEIKSRNFWRAKNWSLYDYCLLKRLPEGRDISRNDHRRRHRLWRSDDVAIQSNIIFAIFGRSEASLKSSALEALLPNSVALKPASTNHGYWEKNSWYYWTKLSPLRFWLNWKLWPFVLFLTNILDNFWLLK